MNRIAVRAAAGLLAGGVTAAGLAGISGLAAHGPADAMPVVTLPAVTIVGTLAPERVPAVPDGPGRGEPRWTDQAVASQAGSSCRC